MKERQKFKGESLAHGPMDGMSGKLAHNEVATANAAAKAKPATVTSKTSHVVYSGVDDQSALSDSSHFRIV